jgi:hypothetical protein
VKKINIYKELSGHEPAITRLSVKNVGKLKVKEKFKESPLRQAKDQDP